MEQSQQLAFADSALTMNANAIEQGSLRADHIDVWIKGNAGDVLTNVEEEVYRILFTQRQNQAFYNWIALNSIDTGFEGVGPKGLARFLHLYPGARAEWRRRTAEIERLGVWPDGVFPEFAAEVSAGLQELEDLSGPP